MNVTNEQVEFLARAFCEEAGLDPDMWLSGPSGMSGSWFTGSQWQFYRRAARERLFMDAAVRRMEAMGLL